MREKNWTRTRYLADFESMFVHDRWTGECTEEELHAIVRRGDALGFEPDTLCSALEMLFKCCPRCVPGDDAAEARRGGDYPPPAFTPSPLAPRGPILSAGNAESMEHLASEDDVQAA